MRRVFGLGLVGLAVLCGACGKKASPEGPSIRPATSADRHADGQALAKAFVDWKKRWQREPPPPACDEPLVKSAEDRKLCAATAEALARLQERVKADAPAPELMTAASQLALTGSHAEKRLRMLAMEYLATQGASAAASAAPSASARAPKAPPNPSSRALPGLAASAVLGDKEAAQSMVRSLATLEEHGKDHGVVGRDNPYQPLVRGHSKLSVQALRFLGMYLEYAPLPFRSAAIAELERLNADHQPWHQLAQVARQAALLEQTPELKTRLSKLDPLGGANRKPRAPKP